MENPMGKKKHQEPRYQKDAENRPGPPDNSPAGAAEEPRKTVLRPLSPSDDDVENIRRPESGPGPQVRPMLEEPSVPGGNSGSGHQDVRGGFADSDFDVLLPILSEVSGVPPDESEPRIRLSQVRVGNLNAFPVETEDVEGPGTALESAEEPNDELEGLVGRWLGLPEKTSGSSDRARGRDDEGSLSYHPTVTLVSPRTKKIPKGEKYDLPRLIPDQEGGQNVVDIVQGKDGDGNAENRDSPYDVRFRSCHASCSNTTVATAAIA